MIARKHFFQLLFSIVFAAGCKTHYEPPAIQSGVTALVVDGFINNSSDTTFLHLSHTNKLKDGVNHADISGAQLSIEDGGGNTLYNFEQLNDSGIYIVPGMNLDLNSKYRLRIFANNKQYLSEELPVIKTPPIDSITFEHTAKGVSIYANAHDATNNTRYYRWEYTETYQYHVPYYSGLIYSNGGLGERPLDQQIYMCWKTNNNPLLLTSTTAKLSQDIVYHYVLRFVDQNAFELSLKYLIKLRQFALTKECYDYLQNLKKITEQTGSIFDAQPSQLAGNIHCVNDPSEPVLGYMMASTREARDLYITTDQVQPWDSRPDCLMIEIKPIDIISAFGSGDYIPIALDGGPFNLKGVFASSPQCADCTIYGGVTTKPYFFQ